ncbi:hypothetical protein [Nonomuraea jabiensis]|uniref:hypothetical protein n=1 Tax=Nonomuraea jabiensis TaxID=882448 RepID=UPI003D724167
MTSAMMPDATATPSRSPNDQPDPSRAATLPATRDARLPRPAPPTAHLAPATLDLGAAGTGAFTVNIAPGTGIWSASDAGTRVRIARDGTVHLDAPSTEPDCPGGPRRASETVIISWSGRNVGDGVHTSGTSRASGVLALSVTWQTAPDDDLVAAEDGSGSSGDCYPAWADHPRTLRPQARPLRPWRAPAPGTSAPGPARIAPEPIR